VNNPKMIYVAFDGRGNYCQNVHAETLGAMRMLLHDRRKNGDAFPGEHPVLLSVPTLNWIRQQLKLPPYGVEVNGVERS